MIDTHTRMFSDLLVLGQKFIFLTQVEAKDEVFFLPLPSNLWRERTKLQKNSINEDYSAQWLVLMMKITSFKKEIPYDRPSAVGI